MKVLNSRKKQRILALVSSNFLNLVLTSMDFLSFGSKFLKAGSHGVSAENISFILFLYPSIVAQLVFGIFTEISGGICSGVIVEAQKATRTMHEACISMADSFGEAVFSTYICIFLSTILFAAISFVCYRFRIGSNLRRIPLTALYGVMGSIGYISLECGFYEIYTGTPWVYRHHCFAISLLLAFFVLWLDMRYPSYFLLLPTVAFAIVVVFHATFFAAGKDMDWMRATGLLPEAKNMNLMYTELSTHFKLSNINVRAIASNWKTIAGLALFNMIHIVVNIPSLAETTGMKCDLDTELRAQSMGNFASAFLGYPTYLICSTSIYFNKSGGRSRMYSIAGAATMCSLIFAGSYVRAILPVVLVATIPMFIGISFLYSFVYLPMRKLSYPDFCIMAACAVVSCIWMPVYGLAFGVAANTLWILLSYSKSLSAGGGVSELKVRPESMGSVGKGLRTVEIDFLVFFGTVDKLREWAGDLDADILFDIRKCGHFDANANMALEEIVREIVRGGHQVQILGHPFNLYTHLFSEYMVGSGCC